MSVIEGKDEDKAVAGKEMGSVCMCVCLELTQGGVGEEKRSQSWEGRRQRLRSG